MTDPRNELDPPILSYANPESDHRGNRFTFGFHGNPWLQLLGLSLLIIGAIWLVLPSRSGGGPSPRVACMSNLRQIGMAMAAYAQDHSGYYPHSPADVVDYPGPTSFPTFVCPEGHATSAPGETLTDKKRNLLDPSARHCSYVFDLPGARVQDMTAKHVVAHELPDGHKRGGINVLFGDMTVRPFDGVEAAHVVAELRAGFNPPRPFTPSAR
jgi:hypothetical protein